MFNITGSIVGSTLTLNTVLEVGPTYALQVPSFNQQPITSFVDQLNNAYPVYVGETGPLTAGYLIPTENLYFIFNGTYCSVIPRNPFIQVYTIGQAELSPGGSDQAPSSLLNFSGSNLTTTGSIAANSSLLTLASALDFVNGQGITIEGAGVAGADLQAAQIVSGAGTVFLTLNVTASTSVSNTIVHHDDTVSIQNAINNSAVVELPVSTPQISNTITIHSNFRMSGAGRNSTVLEWYKSSTTGAVGSVDWMIVGTYATDVTLEGFGLVGPGYKGPSGGGIFVGNLDAASTNVSFRDLKVSEMPGTCYQLYTPILSRVSNCIALSFGGTGYQLSTGTSTILESSYAVDAYYGAGFDLNGCAYMTLMSTAADNCAVAYDFQKNRGVTFCSSGSEVPSYASAAFPGLHYRFDNDTNITLVSPFSRGFSYYPGDVGSNAFYVVSNGASINVIKGETNSTAGTEATTTYIVDSTSKVHYVDPFFTGPYAGEGTVAPGGVVSIQMDTWETLAGTTSGTVTYIMPEQGNGIKTFKVYANGYSNTSGTAQSITFPVAFQNAPSTVFNDTGMAVTVSATGMEFPATVSGSSFGMIIFEGV